MNRNATLLAGAVLVAALQIGFLGWTIAGRASVLRNGQEVLLKVEPVDPRDLLRGDYVRLGYEAASFPLDLRVGPAGSADSDAVWVLVRQSEDGVHRPVAYAWTREALPAPGPEEAVLGARTQYFPQEGPVRVSYGIERFYLPEGAGKPIERDMRERPFFVVAAVPASGEAQIKRFLDGETVIFEEPPY